MSDHVKGMTSCRPPEKSNESEIKSNESEMDLINRIECAIRHIQTAVDVDPWAVEIAVEAMQKQIPQKPKMPLDACWVCPTCGSKVEHPFEHCRRCGQKICWEEDEE